MAKTQASLITNHLRSGRSISPLEALGLYGVFRLAAVVHRLREQGMDIQTVMKEDINGHPYAEYRLARKPKWLNTRAA